MNINAESQKKKLDQPINKTVSTSPWALTKPLVMLVPRNKRLDARIFQSLKASEEA